MAISMMVSGLTTKQMAMVFTSMLMEHNMKESGRMIFNMAKELKLGQMVLDTKVTMGLVESMESVLINGMMVRNTQEIGKKTKLAESVYIHGLMVVNMKENGRIITWKA